MSSGNPMAHYDWVKVRMRTGERLPWAVSVQVDDSQPVVGRWEEQAPAEQGGESLRRALTQAYADGMEAGARIAARRDDASAKTEKGTP